MKIYIDGGYFEKDDARVSVFDHGLLYGDGVFEGIRVYGGNIFRLGEHIRRLYESAHAILLEIPLSQAEMEAAVSETVRLNSVHDGYIRLIITRGKGSLGIDPSTCKRPTVIIIADELQVYPKEYYDKGISIVTSSTRRIPSDSLEPRVKSLNYLNNILARLEAKKAGCLEAVMLNGEGFVAECTVDNIFIVKDGRLLTPPAYHGALEGITMKTVLEIAGEMGIDGGFQPLTRFDLYTADECFITGTGAEIMPVTEIDGRPIGSGLPGAITKKLMEEFRSLVYRQ